MFEITVIVAVIIGVSELLKKLEFIPARFIPLLTVVLGTGAGFIWLDGDIKTKLFYGIVIGLSAAGLYDQSKIVTKK